MDNLKIIERKDEQENIFYEVYMEYVNWQKYLEFIYNELVENNIYKKDMKVNGFRSPKHTPNILMELKFNHLFEYLKEKAFENLLINISNNFLEKKNDYEFKEFKLDQENNLFIFFKKKDLKNE